MWITIPRNICLVSDTPYLCAPLTEKGKKFFRKAGKEKAAEKKFLKVIEN
jgi:hypothetical protein